MILLPKYIVQKCSVITETCMILIKTQQKYKVLSMETQKNLQQSN
jgi:hypothetical protein